MGTEYFTKTRRNKRIVLGKQSSGWQFVFNHNNWKYFGKSKESLKKFLENRTIFSEYGEQITAETFWERVEARKGGRQGLEGTSIGTFRLEGNFILDGLVFNFYTE